MKDQYSANSFYLVRHGEAENNLKDILNASVHTEYHLTSRGKQQAQEATEYLKQYPIDFIVTSPLARAQETGMIIAQQLGVSLSIDSRLTETRFGSFEGQGIQSFLRFMQEHGGRTVGDPDHQIEGYMDIRERVQALLSDIGNSFQGKHIILVSHLDTLQELYAELLGEPVGAEQGEYGWYPEKGSVAVVNRTQPPYFFIPERKA